jgi:hypothetical protein
MEFPGEFSSIEESKWGAMKTHQSPWEVVKKE